MPNMCAITKQLAASTQGVAIEIECDAVMSCDRDETESALILAMESTCDPKGYYDEGSPHSMSLDIAAAVLLSDGSVAAMVAP